MFRRMNFIVGTIHANQENLDQHPSVIENVAKLGGMDIAYMNRIWLIWQNGNRFYKSTP